MLSLRSSCDDRVLEEFKSDKVISLA